MIIPLKIYKERVNRSKRLTPENCDLYSEGKKKLVKIVIK